MKPIKYYHEPAVAIGYLERFAADYERESGNISLPEIAPANGIKIAVVGSGPAGLAASYLLSNSAYKVDIYEKHCKLGGLLRYGIPEFRLEKSLLDKWLEKFILNDNIKVHTNIELGKNISLEELKKEYDAVILAFGANISNKMNIPGEDKEFVLGGNELLEYRC